MIDSFSGYYSFLSNFYFHELNKTNEHYYQAMKTTDHIWIIKILSAPSPSIAKKLGRNVPIRDDWEDIKLEVMEGLVRHKFRDYSKMRNLLLMTRDEELIEGNYWGNTFWGVCNGIGENHLGKILMKVRDELNPHVYQF